MSWLLSLIIAIVYTFENPGKLEIIKNYFSKDKIPWVLAEQGEIQRTPGNYFITEFSTV